MDENILHILNEVGLTEGESKVYLALIELGSSSIGNIIKESNVSASKVYIILDKLIDKGFATIAIENNIKIFSATDPKQVLIFLENKKKKIDEDKEKFETILPSLNLKRNSANLKPLVEFGFGTKAHKNFISELLDDLEDKGEYITFGSYDISQKFLPFWVEVNNELIKKNAKINITYDYHSWSQKGRSSHRKKRTNYFPKVLDKKFNDIPDLAIVKDKLVMADFEGDKIFSVIIRSKALTKSMIKLYNVLRGFAKVPKGYET